MTRTIHGRLHGRTIELDEDLGIPDGQEVEVQIQIIPPTATQTPEMSEAQAKIYEILGERYDSGRSDLAERHNEHQP